MPATSTQIRLDRRERHGALATLVCLRTHACREVQCCGGEVEERRSGGAEEQRSGGAEERRSGGEAEHSMNSMWWMPREVRAG